MLLYKGEGYEIMSQIIKSNIRSKFHRLVLKGFKNAPYGLVILNIIMFIIFTLLQSKLEDLHQSIIDNERISIEQTNELFFKEMNNALKVIIDTERIDPFNVEDLQSVYNRFNIDYDISSEYATKYLLTYNYDQDTRGYYYTIIQNGIEYKLATYTKDSNNGQHIALINVTEFNKYVDTNDLDYYNPFLNRYDFDQINEDYPNYIDAMYDAGIIADDAIFNNKEILNKMSKLTYNPNRNPEKMSANIGNINYSYYYLTIPNIGNLENSGQHRRLIILNFINEDELKNSFNQRNMGLITIIRIINLLVIIDILLIAILLVYIKIILQNIKRGDASAKSEEAKSTLYKSFLDGSNDNDIL